MRRIRGGCRGARRKEGKSGGNLIGKGKSCAAALLPTAFKGGRETLSDHERHLDMRESRRSVIVAEKSSPAADKSKEKKRKCRKGG